MAEQNTGPVEMGAEMDYPEHEKTYEVFGAGQIWNTWLHRDHGGNGHRLFHGGWFHRWNACCNHPFRSWFLPAEIVRARKGCNAQAPSADGVDAVQEN